MSDWADRDTKEILGWIASFGGDEDLPSLIAQKLRLVRQDGYIEGFARCREVVDAAFKAEAKPPTPSQVAERIRAVAP